MEGTEKDWPELKEEAVLGDDGEGLAKPLLPQYSGNHCAVSQQLSVKEKFWK